MRNQTTTLAEVVSLDAWHDEFSRDVRAVDLFVDVVFSSGRLGSEDDAVVRFDLCIRRAEVVVIVLPTEPLAVDPASVSREVPAVSGKKRALSKNSRSWGAKLHAGARYFGVPQFSGRAGVNAAFGRSSSETVERTEDLKAISVRASKTEDAHYRWTLTAALNDFLDGRPWNPNAEPRLKLVDKRAQAKGLPPAVRIEVRCCREDLLISNVTLKNRSRWAAVKSRTGYRNREIAAEAYIRDQLLRRGIVVGDMRDTSAQMTISVTTPEPRPKY